MSTIVNTASSIRPLKPALLISDLHLSDSDPHGIQWFTTFTKWLDKSVCEELFILGDLFDYWVGPRQLSIQGYRPVFAALNSLKQKGIAVTILRGNRDVYLEDKFAAASGATIGQDVVLLEAGGKRVLLMHGDLLCTKDVKYQRFRKFLRSKPIAWLAPRLPLSIGMFLARGLRGYSKRVVPQKYPAEKSIVDETIQEYLRLHNADILICGHVHELQDRPISLGENKHARLIVLPAFEIDQPPLIFRNEFQFAETNKKG